MNRPFLALLSGGLLSLLAFAVQGASEPRWVATRIGVTPERTRLVLELDREAKAPQLQSATDSSATVILPGVSRADRLSLPELPAGFLHRLVASALSGAGNGTKLELRFDRRAQAKVFALDADGSLPARVVVDLNREAVGFTSPSATKGAGEKKPPADVRHVVVIDAGHGGEDPGATGGGLEEKEVALDVATRLGRALSSDKEFEVLQTRSTDVRVPLRQRYRVAEERGADLFLSIHLNASKSGSASGAEVFFLSLGAATDEAAKEAARLENESDPEYVVPTDEALQDLPFALDLRQSDTLRRSSHAALVLLDLLRDRKLAESRGVKQAGFAVLKSYQVPSVLVEIGFISSAEDRARLKEPEYRDRLAEALADGVREWFRQFAPERHPR